MTRVFRIGQVAKRADTGEQVKIVEVLPYGRLVWYRIEYMIGDTTLVPETMLREIVSRPRESLRAS
jgi:hypothetical protein